MILQKKLLEIPQLRSNVDNVCKVASGKRKKKPSIKIRKSEMAGKN